MIDLKIKKLADDFVTEWSKFLVVNPVLELDYSWPSLGVLDLITFTCRFKKELPQQLDDMLKGVSAYLAIMAEKCFSSVVSEVLVKDESNNIVIFLTGGKYIPENEEVIIPLERMLRNILSELPSPLPVTRNFKTDIAFESQIISLFGIGVFTGMSPGIEGWWSTKEEDFLDPIIENTCKVLAIGSADKYAKLFPQEPIGQLAEFYLNKLIYPPMMMKENLPLLESVTEVLQYFKDYKISADAALKLGEGLALSPDPLFSNLGLILCCALSKKIPSGKILASAHSKGSSLAFLRRSVRKVREFFGIKQDWIESGLTSPELYSQLAIEKSMKFLPWLVLSKDRIKKDLGDHILAPFIISICDYNIVEAIRLADKIIEVRPDDAEIILQRLKLEMMKKSHADISKITQLEKLLMSNATADSIVEYYAILGSLNLSRKDPAKALTYFKGGISLESNDPTIHSDLLNNAAWCCMLLNKLGQALIYLNQGYQSSNCPVTILLNKASVLWDLGDFSNSLADRNKLYNLSPLDRRVFASLTLSEVVKNYQKH